MALLTSCLLVFTDGVERRIGHGRASCCRICQLHVVSMLRPPLPAHQVSGGSCDFRQRDGGALPGSDAKEGAGQCRIREDVNGLRDATQS